MSDVEKGSVQATTPQQAFRNVPARVGVANPGALGLFSFASTTLILSLYNVSARGTSPARPNAVVGMALFCGGLAQFLAGMWEFPRGNMFGATAFTSYGAFWLSYATIYIPGSGILDAFAENETELPSAVGIYLMTWMTVTFLLFIVSLRKSISFISLFGFLTLTFMMLGAGEFTGNANLGKAGGALGIITALIAYYIGLSELLAAEKAAVVQLPLFAFKHD